MAYVKCSGGGKLQETLLWENTNKASNGNYNALAPGEVNINYDYRNFTFLKTEYCRVTTLPNESYYAWFTPADIINCYLASENKLVTRWGIYCRGGSGSSAAISYCVRSITPVQSNGVFDYTKLTINESNSLYDTSKQNTRVIFKTIWGLK